MYLVTCDDGCGAAVTMLFDPCVPPGWDEVSDTHSGRHARQFVERSHLQVWARSTLPAAFQR